MGNLIRGKLEILHAGGHVVYGEEHYEDDTPKPGNLLPPGIKVVNGGGSTFFDQDITERSIAPSEVEPLYPTDAEITARTTIEDFEEYEELADTEQALNGALQIKYSGRATLVEIHPNNNTFIYEITMNNVISRFEAGYSISESGVLLPIGWETARPVTAMSSYSNDIPPMLPCGDCLDD